MTQITKEAIEAAHAILWERDKAVCSQNSVEAALTAALSFLPIAVEAPEGWQLMPIEPTDEILMALADGHSVSEGYYAASMRRVSIRRYGALLAAAPVSPSSPGKDGGQEVEAVASIVPPNCSGYSFVFEPGVLRVKKDGSGTIVVNEDDFVLEDDRCEGPDGPEGSIHWIARIDASEIIALRDFLNGSTSATQPASTAEDGRLFDALQHESWDLRCFNVPTGGEDYDIGWRVVGHWQAEPQERVIAEIFHDDPREAIRSALSSSESTSREVSDQRKMATAIHYLLSQDIGHAEAVRRLASLRRKQADRTAASP